MFMNRRSFTILLTFLLSGVLGSMAQQPDPAGRKLYERQCSRCHGKNGSRGLLGAKNLRISKLNDHELYNIISEGKRIMPSWKEKLAPEQILLLARYVKSLRSAGNQQ
jgi:cytochrome c6